MRLQYQKWEVKYEFFKYYKRIITICCFSNRKHNSIFSSQHEIEKLMQQHKINIEDLKEKHRLEMEAKDKEYQHEKEMLELKSKVTIDEKNQEVMNSALSGIMGGIFSDVISGKISPEQINDLAKKFPKSNS